MLFSRIRKLATLFAIAGSLLALSACSESVTGIYDVDKAALKETAVTAMKKEMPNEPDAEVRAHAEAVFAELDNAGMLNTTLTLHDDGTALLQNPPPAPSFTGKYSVSGSTFTLSITNGPANFTITGTIKGGTIRLKPPQGQMPFDMVFKKRKT